MLDSAESSRGSKNKQERHWSHGGFRRIKSERCRWARDWSTCSHPVSVRGKASAKDSKAADVSDLLPATASVGAIVSYSRIDSSRVCFACLASRFLSRNICRPGCLGLSRTSRSIANRVMLTSALVTSSATVFRGVCRQCGRGSRVEVRSSHIRKGPKSPAFFCVRRRQPRVCHAIAAVSHPAEVASRDDGAEGVGMLA